MNRGVLAVVVVFERALDDVVPWRWLCQELSGGSGKSIEEDDSFLLEAALIYDNSPAPRAESLFETPRCRYIHDPSNGGTAAAYRAAACLGVDLGITWLLVLDQDTSLPEQFLRRAAAALSMLESAPPAVLLPWVSSGGVIISPSVVSKCGSIRPMRRVARRRAEVHITAISSGAIFNVSEVPELRAIPRELWLDYVDHWIFYRLHARETVLAIFDTCIHHDLSIASPKTVSPRRLRSVLDGERYFFQSLGALARFTYPFRILARLGRYVFVAPQQALVAIAWAVARMRDE